MTPSVAPSLETERLRLRAPEAGDIPAWTAFLGSERARFMGGPIDAATAWRIFAQIAGHWGLRGYGSWTVTLRRTGRAIGMAGAWHPADWPAPELAYSIWQDGDEGQGYAAEAVIAARDHLMAGPSPMLMSYIDAANARSIRLAERVGAVHEPDAPVSPGGATALAYRHRLRAQVAA